MSLRTQLIAGAVLALAVVGGAWWLHHSGYERGRADEHAEAVLQKVAVEQGMQYESDQNDAKYRGAVLAREAAQKDAAAVRARLDRLLRANGRDAQSSHASGGSDGTGPDWIGGFSACYREYADLASDAARWADQVNGLQGYVRAIREGSDK